MSDVSHDALFQKLVEHDAKLLSYDAKIAKMGTDIHGINQQLGPIVVAVTSMALGFKTLLWIGAISAALLGMLELYDHIAVLQIQRITP